MPSVYLETYGCQMNLADSELIVGQLARAGYDRVPDPAAADVILINTCAIREHAEERVLGRVGDLARHKLRRPHVQIGLAGCMAQHMRDRLLGEASQLDFVVGPDSYRRLPVLLAGGDPFVDVRLERDETYADLSPLREDGVRAWITVMRGCDKFCTFCIVPYVRGRERSLAADAVIAQVEAAANAGYREVVFLGQTVNAYRDRDVDFGRLLRRGPVPERCLELRPRPAVLAHELERSSQCRVRQRHRGGILRNAFNTSAALGVTQRCPEISVANVEKGEHSQQLDLAEDVATCLGDRQCPA